MSVKICNHCFGRIGYCPHCHCIKLSEEKKPKFQVGDKVKSKLNGTWLSGEVLRVYFNTGPSIDYSVVFTVGMAVIAESDLKATTEQPLKTKSKYYICGDINTQWFTILVEMNEAGEPIWNAEVSTKLDAPFINEIFSRDVSFTNKNMLNNNWQGWSLTKTEFSRIKRLVELMPLVEEFNKLKQV